jgi:uncharacterized paraquat-inducible protein A
MPQCRQCKTLNESDAEYCTGCGSVITPGIEWKEKRNVFITASIFLLALFVILYVPAILSDVMENAGIEIVTTDFARLGLGLVAIVLLLKSNKMGAYLAIIFAILELAGVIKGLAEPSDTQVLNIVDFLLTLLMLVFIAGGWKSLK